MNKFILLLLILFAAARAEAQTSVLAIADSLYVVGDYSEAVEQLEAILEKSDVVLLKLAKAYEAAGDYQAALKNYSAVIENDPERILAAVSYGKLLSRTGKLEKADTVFLRLSEKYPQNSSFHYQRGLVKEKQRDSTALKFFSKAAMLDKTHQQAHFKLAKDMLSRGKFAAAAGMGRRGLESNPHYASLLSILAQALYHQKKYPEAIVEFAKLVALGEGNGFVHSRLGASWAKGRKYENAIKEYKIALEYEDKNFVTHHSLGKLYALTGDYKNSELHLLMAVLLKDVSLDEEFFSLGLTYKLSEDYKNAVEYFSKAIEENSDNERAWYERAIAADSYFKDLETRLNYYQAYLNKYEKDGNRNLVHLVSRRIKDIREEMHLAE